MQWLFAACIEKEKRFIFFVCVRLELLIIVKTTVS